MFCKLLYIKTIKEKIEEKIWTAPLARGGGTVPDIRGSREKKLYVFLFHYSDNMHVFI